METDPVTTALVRGYLERLHAAGWSLDPARRSELVAEVREHIGVALAHEAPTGRGSEVAARNVLERLGSPEDIVRAETEASGHPVGAVAGPQPRPTAESGWGGLEIAAVAVLCVGGLFLPVVGTLIGLALAWASPRWRPGQKAVASAVVVTPLLLAVLISVMS